MRTTAATAIALLVALAVTGGTPGGAHAAPPPNAPPSSTPPQAGAAGSAGPAGWPGAAGSPGQAGPRERAGQAGPRERAGAVPAGAPARPASSLADAIREVVYVTSGMDSDSDGRQDRIGVQLVRPAETAQGLKVASVIHASPYFGTSAARAGQQSGLTVPEPVGIAPLHFGAWYDDYFVPRGYAVVEVEMQGTSTSDGCAATGGEADTLSAKAAVDWLNGRATASYADGTPAVASWSTGNVGMIGVSYAGTLPIALAETGIAGLKTIVPIASISSWYDYARAAGIAYGGFGSRYPQALAETVSSNAALTRCTNPYQQLGDNADDANYDDNAFWRQRDYRDGVDRITASVFLVHGQQDSNTKTTQVGRYWDALAARGVPRKLWLHDGSHVDPFLSDPAGRDTVGRWMDRWLYGTDNGVMSEPQVTIKRPDGATTTYPSWPAPQARQASLYLGGPGDAASGTLREAPAPSGSQSFTDNRGQLEDAMTSAPETVKPNRLVFLGPALTAARRLSGAGSVQVTFTATSTSTPLTALLVHYTDGARTRLVSRGAIDTKNRDSLTAGTPLVPGQRYTATVPLEPKDYIFPTGSRIGLVLVANDGQYIVTDPLAAGVTVDLAASRLILPLVP